MTRPAAALAALLSVAACGGDDEKTPAPWQPPAVDLSRLGVACPAPDVPVIVADDRYPGACDMDRLTMREVPAGDVQPGQWVVGSIGNLVTSVTVIEDAQRLRLVLTDGRTGIFTADHGFFVITDDSQASFYWPLYQLRPGDRLLLSPANDAGVVADVQAAPDGPVVQISAVEDVSHPCYTGAPLDMVNLGVSSLLHTQRTLPTQRPEGR